MRFFLDDNDTSFANLSSGTFVNYGYSGMAFGGGTGAGPKNWEVDYVRFSDENLTGAGSEPLTLSCLAFGAGYCCGVAGLIQAVTSESRTCP